MPPVAPQKLSYSMREIARLVIWAGFRGTRAAIAGSIIMAESGGRRLAVGRNGPTRGCPHGSRDRGLSQINDCYHSEVSDKCAFDTYCNLVQFWRISSHGRSFRPWSTYNSGAYRRFFAAMAELVGNVQQDVGAGPAIPAPVRHTGQPSSLHQALSWAGAALSWGPLGWLESHVAKLAETGARYVYDKLRPLIHDVGVGLGKAVRGIKTVERRAIRWIHDTRVWALHGFHFVENWVRLGLRDLERWARRLVGDAVDWVRRDVWAPLNRAWHNIENWVKHDVIPFFHRLYEDALGFIRAVRDFLIRVLHDLEHWARNAVDFLHRLLNSALDWIEKFGKRAWDIIDKCWWFLVFVATHPLDWWIILLRDFASRAPQMLAGVAAAAMREFGDDIERVISRWLGNP